MSHEPQAPKGIAWLIVYRLPGERASYVEVEHNGHGLTAYEAWEVSSVPVSFSDVRMIQLDSYPTPVSVNTKENHGKPKRERTRAYRPTRVPSMRKNRGGVVFARTWKPGTRKRAHAPV